MGDKFDVNPDRFFDPEPGQRSIARALYEEVKDLPLICPHGHVDPRFFSDPDAGFGTPADLLVIPDHYIFRMLYSQGIPLERLGIPGSDGVEVETDHRKIWQLFADHFHLFRGTPSGAWLNHELHSVFGIEQHLAPTNAQEIYDQISEQLCSPAFRPRALYERFGIEVLCTTDAATDSLEHHKRIRESGWTGDIRPTFRPDNVINIRTPGWRENIVALSDASGVWVDSYGNFIRALECRRTSFKELGATATDHAAVTPWTEELSEDEAESIFQNALRGDVTEADESRFTAHMLMEMARMSVEDGLVMQLHCGSLRNHNTWLYEHFGSDKGADIPVPTEFTRNLRPLLAKYGNHPGFTLILFTLDESCYARELAPLAGHYPAVKLGPPWWFHDSMNGMNRYFERVMETAGIYNTVGFNDDTRAFPSIPARHDFWRRVCANWLAGLAVRGVVSRAEACEMALEMAYSLAKRAYRLKGKQGE